MNKWGHPYTDWQQFQKNLLKQFPFIGKDINLKDLQTFVEAAMKTSIPAMLLKFSGIDPSAVSHLDYELFETHRYIFVRCRPPEHTSPRNVRFFANRRKLRIEYGTNSEEILLPSEVNADGISAASYDDVFEIRLPKLDASEPLREIFIRDE